MESGESTEIKAHTRGKIPNRVTDLFKVKSPYNIRTKGE